MLNRLFSIITKELIQFSQDRLLLLFTLIAPVVELILIGGGASGGLSDISMAVIDRDRSELSRTLITVLDNTDELSVNYYPEDFAEAEVLIDRGDVSVLLSIPEQFGSDLGSGVPVSVQLIIDGSNVLVAAESLGVAQAAIESTGWEIALAAYEGIAPRRGIELRQEALYNQALESRPYELTAMFCFIMLEVLALVAVMSIVREREIGTLEQVTITPIRQYELLIGKAVGPMIITFMNFTIMYTLLIFMFKIPMRGSLLLILVMTLIYMVAEVSVALMISAISRTQQQAITILFIYIMVALTMSGYMVPTTRLPPVLRSAASILPVRHLIEIMRSIMLKGAGIAELWPSIAALFILAAAVSTITILSLRRLGR
nr:ABC transporter permease [Anaerolineae bacterium]